jgi:hypothetical protein
VSADRSSFFDFASASIQIGIGCFSFDIAACYRLFVLLLSTRMPQ